MMLRLPSYASVTPSHPAHSSHPPHTAHPAHSYLRPPSHACSTPAMTAVGHPSSPSSTWMTMRYPTPAQSLVMQPQLQQTQSSASTHLVESARAMEAAEREKRHEARRERNRVAAQRSRSRKRDLHEELESRIRDLEDAARRDREEWAEKERVWRERVVALETENKMLRSGEWVRHQTDKANGLARKVQKLTAMLHLPTDALSILDSPSVHSSSSVTTTSSSASSTSSTTSTTSSASSIHSLLNAD
eukprot:ANDGO_05743.mRNA.1 hypothetical protein